MTDSQLMITRFLEQSARYLGQTDTRDNRAEAPVAVSLPIRLVNHTQTGAVNRIYQ